MPLSMQSSLVPSVVGLAEFFRSSFPFIDWYPYWYLGTPFRYLIGPVVPLLLFFGGKRSQLVVFDYYFYLGIVVFSILLGGIGLYWFIVSLRSNRLSFTFDKVAFLAGLLYVLSPVNWSMLYFQDGLKIVAFAVIPYVFLLYSRWIVGIRKNHMRWWRISILIFLLSLCLLISVDVLLSLVVGVMILLFLQKRHIVISVSVFLLGICVATVWYTPRFWWVLFANPSFGGIPLWNVVLNLFFGGLQFLPFVLAILIVKWRHVKLQKHLSFGVYFLFSFFILSLVRFLSNPVFVVDWIGFGVELQFGAAILGGTFFGQLIRKSRRQKIFISFFFIALLAISIFLVRDVFFYTKTPYQSKIISFFIPQGIYKNERIFSSGSPVFWINQYLPIQQVRGANDMVSVNSSWAVGAYQVREGVDVSLTQDWLRIFGTKYVLINGSNSYELFHDFKHIEKFSTFPVVKHSRGDTLLTLPNIWMARVAKKALLSIEHPRNGADAHSLSAYTRTLVRQASLIFERPDILRVQGMLQSDEVFSLAVSYDTGWRLLRGEGTIASDTFGNVVIIPKHSGRQDFLLEYHAGWRYIIVVMVVMIFLVMGIIFSEIVTMVVEKWMQRLHLGVSEEEEY